MEKKKFNVSALINPQLSRLDKFLQSQLGNFSRTRLQNLIKEGNVLLNNQLVHEASKKIREKDVIEINFPPPKKTQIKP